MPTTPYDPERSIAEIRAALLDREESFRQLNDSMVRAAARAESDLWPDPKLREAAGLGAIVAAASVAAIARPGGETTMLNLTAMFGLALVDSARDEFKDEPVTPPYVAEAERPWCGAPREMGGQQPCLIKVPCDERTCRIGSAVGSETYKPDTAPKASGEHPAESSFAPFATMRDTPDPMYPEGEAEPGHSPGAANVLPDITCTTPDHCTDGGDRD